jgi:hypothetical protein
MVMCPQRWHRFQARKGSKMATKEEAMSKGKPMPIILRARPGTKTIKALNRETIMGTTIILHTFARPVHP